MVLHILDFIMDYVYYFNCVCVTYFLCFIIYIFMKILVYLYMYVLQGPYVYHVLCTDWATLVKYE